MLDVGRLAPAPRNTMTSRLRSVVVLAIACAFVLYALSRDYLNVVSTGRSLWWFALEFVIVAAMFGCIWLLGRVLPTPDLETVTGVRAVAGILVVIAVFIPAVAAGFYLDSLLGFELSVGSMLAFAALTATLQLVGAWLSTGTSAADETVQSGELPAVAPDSTPPN